MNYDTHERTKQMKIRIIHQFSSIRHLLSQYGSLSAGAPRMVRDSDSGALIFNFEPAPLSNPELHCIALQSQAPVRNCNAEPSSCLLSLLFSFDSSGFCFLACRFLVSCTFRVDPALLWYEHCITHMLILYILCKLLSDYAVVRAGNGDRVYR